MTLALCLVLGLSAVCVNAHGGGYLYFDFEGFEGADNGQTIVSGLKIQNGVADLNGVWSATAGRGTSVLMKSSAEATKSGMQICNNSAQSWTEKAIYEISVQALDTKCARRLSLRGLAETTDTKLKDVVRFETEGKIKVFGAEIGSYVINEWYDVKIGVDLVNKLYNVTVSGNGTEYQTNGAIGNNLNGMTILRSFWFTHAGVVDAQSYVDDIRFYETDSIYRGESYDFNNFEANDAGNAAPGGFKTSNVVNRSSDDATYAGIFAADDAEDGKCVNIKAQRIGDTAAKNAEIYIQKTKGSLEYDGTVCVKASFCTGDKTVAKHISLRDTDGAKTTGIKFITFGTDGKVYFHSNNYLMDYECGVWYDTEFKYNTKTGCGYVSVSDGKNKKTMTRYFEKEVLDVERVYFSLEGGKLTDGQSAECKFDNISVFETDDIYSGFDYTYDFDSFAGSEDGQTAPDGLIMQNTGDGAGVYSASADGKNYIEIRTNGTLSPQLIKQLPYSMLGKYNMEFAVNVPSDAQSAVKVGFKTSEDGAVCKYPLELNADGKIIIGGAESGTFTKGAWYNVKLEFNTEYNSEIPECTVTVTDGTESVTGTATLSASNLMHARVEIMPEANAAATPSSVYIDDLKVYTVLPFDIETSDPANRSVVSTPDKLYITLTNPIDASVGTVQFNNNTAVSVSGLTLTNGSRTLEIPVEAESGKYSTVRLIGLKDIFGNTLSDFVNFSTVSKSFNFGYVVFTNSDGEDITKIEPGTITATVKVRANASDTKKVVLYTALYNADTKEMLAISSDKCTVDQTEKTLTAALTVDDDDVNYNMKSFLWEDVTPLIQCAELISK